MHAERDLVPAARPRRIRGLPGAADRARPADAAGPAGRRAARRHLGLRGAALRAAVLDALAEVRLPEPERIARAYPHEISGGQRQRVAIAAALACRPRLLIADEPTTALDVTVQAEMLTLLERLVAERGMALLFVSHDLAVVSRMTERALVLRAGRVGRGGAIGQLLARPAATRTRPNSSRARADETDFDAAPGGDR